MRTYSFKKDKNLRSFLRMRGLHFDGEGNIWQKKERCEHGLNCQDRTCFIQLRILGKNKNNDYVISIDKHTNPIYISAVIRARFFNIPSFFGGRLFYPLQKGQMYHIIDNGLRVDGKALDGIFLIDKEPNDWVFLRHIRDMDRLLCYRREEIEKPSRIWARRIFI